MTLKYRILRRLVKMAGIRKYFALDKEELLERRRKANAKNKIPNLKDKDFDISRIDVLGFPVLKLVHKHRAERANLFIIGGGMVMPPRPDSIKKALKIARQTGLDLYIPYYPLCTDYPINRAYEMIHETYKLMLEDYTPDHISVLGTSSGGNLALGMVAYINDGHKDVPMPSHIIAISPGTCVDSEEEKERLKELDKKDFIIPASLMDHAAGIMRHGDDSVPDYMVFLQKGDFTDCPKLTLIYGSDETLYAFAPSFDKALKKCNRDYRLIVGEGMFHCYPVFPFCKEAKEGWNQMIELLKED